ncbi:hypothetical protein K402DRAFT_399184 [Aulographum hederae CBS 113979]|uniref:Uncharacterized protein n=1 Tax=Aulographum hederae CBS 113979 TaxID=1176131 RepID=A0A6G1GIK0_9PEZI|nr:hypothetical protein K402DRAFT_399184 [Aulographum hederae CBS 113979]
MLFGTRRSKSLELQAASIHPTRRPGGNVLPLLLLSSIQESQPIMPASATTSTTWHPIKRGSRPGQVEQMLRQLQTIEDITMNFVVCWQRDCPVHITLKHTAPNCIPRYPTLLLHVDVSLTFSPTLATKVGPVNRHKHKHKPKHQPLRATIEPPSRHDGSMTQAYM